MGQRSRLAALALCRHEVRRVNELQFAPRVLSPLAMGVGVNGSIGDSSSKPADAEMVLGGFLGGEEGVLLLCHDVVAGGLLRQYKRPQSAPFMGWSFWRSASRPSV